MLESSCRSSRNVVDRFGQTAPSLKFKGAHCFKEKESYRCYFPYSGVICTCTFFFLCPFFSDFRSTPDQRLSMVNNTALLGIGIYVLQFRCCESKCCALYNGNMIDQWLNEARLCILLLTHSVQQTIAEFIRIRWFCFSKLWSIRQHYCGRHAWTNSVDPDPTPLKSNNV